MAEHFWALYLGGGLMAASGLTLLAWALLWDRSRGRKRCPRCWYEMTALATGQPRPCPECGHQVKRERQLGRTRRKRWPAAGAIFIILLGAAVGTTPQVHQHGWVHFTPTTVLLLLIPSIDTRQHPVLVTLSERFGLEHVSARTRDDDTDLPLWRWQRRLLADRCRATLAGDPPQAAGVFALGALHALGPDALPALDELRALLRSGDSMLVSNALTVICSIGRDARPAVADIFPIVEQTRGDVFVLPLAVRALSGFGPDAAPAVPALTGLLDHPSGTVYLWERIEREAVSTLGAIGPDAEPALPALLKIAGDRDATTRLQAIEAVGRINPLRGDAAGVLLEALRGLETGARSAAATVIGRHDELVERSVPILIDDLRSPDFQRRAAGLRGLTALGPRALSALPELRAALDDEYAVNRLLAVRAIAGLGSSPSAVEAIRGATADPDPMVRRAAGDSLRQLSTREE